MGNIFGLGISLGSAIIILIVLYFVIKWAVKNGIKAAYEDITGKETYEDMKNKELAEEIKNGFHEVKTEIQNKK